MSRKRNRQSEFTGYTDYDEYEPTSSQRTIAEYYSSQRSVINAHVQLPLLGRISMVTPHELNMGLEIEGAIRARGLQGDLTIRNVEVKSERMNIGGRSVQQEYGEVFSDKYTLVRVEGGDRSIVDFIAYNDDYWFPVEVKSQPAPFGDPEKIQIGFRNWRQLRALRLDSNVVPLTDQGKRAIARRGCKRLHGVVIVRFANERVEGGYKQKMACFTPYS